MLVNKIPQKSSLIESARLAREERALKRRKECAATIIQRMVKGYLARFVCVFLIFLSHSSIIE